MVDPPTFGTSRVPAVSSSNAVDSDDQSNGDPVEATSRGWSARDRDAESRDPRNPSSLPRIALFSPAPRYGGAQRVTINIANGLAARGYPVDFVAGRLEGEFVSEIDDTVRTVDLDVPHVPFLGILAGVPALRSYLRSARPDVLFASRTHTNIAAATAAALTDVDVHVAVTEHSAFGPQEGTDDRSGLKDNVMYALAPRAYRIADDIIAVSDGVAESIADSTSIDRSQTTVLHNPIEVVDIRKRSHGQIDHEWLADPDLRPIVSVSRLEPQKNLSLLIKAFAAVHESRPETRLILVGKGTERDRLADLAVSLDIDDAVSFPGYVDNQYVYMRHAAVFALSSRYEGLPTVLIEALACGCTIVSTDCPHGPREVLADGEYGWLTPVDDPDRFADALASALDSPVPPEQSIERAEHFSMEVGTDRYEQYVRTALGRHPE